MFKGQEFKCAQSGCVVDTGLNYVKIKIKIMGL